jgi:hypothetical protein
MRAPGWLLLCLAVPLFAQDDLPVFRTETSLAVVRFHVIRDKRYVTNLLQTDVQLLEDGQPRRITLFEGGQSKPRATPVDVMVLFDISGSVTQEGLLDPLVFKTSLLDAIPHARLGVYGFGGNLLRFCRPTRDMEVLKSAFSRVLNFRSGSRPRPDVIRLSLPPKRKSNFQGGTWIFESVLAGAREAAAFPGDATRMIIVFSDGFPTTTTRPEDVTPAIREMGIPVYPVVLGHRKLVEQIKQVQESGYNRQGVLNDGARDRLGRLQMQEQEIQEFARLGELTGGRSIDPMWVNLEIMRRILGGMVAQVQCEYIAGFAPGAGTGKPTPHKIEVRLRDKKFGKLMGGTRTILHP